MNIEQTLQQLEPRLEFAPDIHARVNLENEAIYSSQKTEFCPYQVFQKKG